MCVSHQKPNKVSPLLSVCSINYVRFSFIRYRQCSLVCRVIMFVQLIMLAFLSLELAIALDLKGIL